MKKLITICLLFFLLNTLSFGQTKEETISWLKEKLTRHLSYHNYPLTITINECEIRITYISNYDKQQHIEIIPTLDTRISNDGAMVNDDQLIVSKNLETGYFVNVNVFECDLADGEKDLRVRVEKAIKHLATFCTKEKKKETF